MRKKMILTLGLVATMCLMACSQKDNAVISNQTVEETTLTETIIEPEKTLSLIQNEKETETQEESTETEYPNLTEEILTNGMSVSDYIAGVQLSREQVRAKNKDTLLAIINNANIKEDEKQQAIQDLERLTEIAEKENAAETLLLAKGFSDPVVSISSDKVDVVINAPSITDGQRAQIEDIVKRKAEVGSDRIVITLLNLSE